VLCSSNKVKVPVRGVFVDQERVRGIDMKFEFGGVVLVLLSVCSPGAMCVLENF